MFVAVVASVASTGSVSITTAAAPELASPGEKVSYALGVNFARQLRTMAGDVDADAMVRGFTDARSTSGSLRLTNQEINTAILALRRTYQQKQAAAQASAGPSATGTPGMAIYFKMDPRLTGGTYGNNDRWVSPPTYIRVGDQRSVVFEARAQALGADRRRIAVSPQWTPSDPEMVDVTPGEGPVVSVTVKRAGTSSIRVSGGTLSKQLTVKAAVRNSVLQVEVSQG